MENIKISVIVPVYNASKFLEKCIRSITEQNLKEIEIICINDGSTDNSLEILKKLQSEDNRIIIINKENEGASKARNTALEIVKGKYCLNIDSDDWIEQGYFKALYERAEKDNLDIILSDIKFDYINNPEKNYILKDLKISNNQVITGYEYINIFLKNNFHGYTCNKLIKTELYKKNNLKYNEDIFMMEDVEIILRLSKYAVKVGKINQAFYHYIQHQSNGNKQISIKRLNDIEICFDSLLKYFNFENEIYFKLINMKCLQIIIYLKKSFKLKNIREYKEIQKEIIKENKNLPYLRLEWGMKLPIIYCNILKLFPYLEIMNLLFVFDIKFIEKIRSLRNIIYKKN